MLAYMAIRAEARQSKDSAAREDARAAEVRLQHDESDAWAAARKG